jgi:hypothetical protein
VAAIERLSRLKTAVQRLQRESFATAGSAQRIVQRGVQQLAEHQLDAIQTHYQSALDSIRAANGASIPELARRQADMLQDTVRRVMVNARESLAIVAATRMELVDLMKKSSKKGGKSAKSRLSQLKAKAKKAVASVKAKAKKAGKAAQKSVNKAKSRAKAAAKKPVAQARAATKKRVAKVKAAAKKAEKSIVKRANAVEKSVVKRATAVKKKVAEAAAPVVSAMQSITPSPLSRAFLATSQGKKEAAEHAASEPAPAPAPEPAPMPENNGTENPPM